MTDMLPNRSECLNQGDEQKIDPENKLERAYFIKVLKQGPNVKNKF